MKKTLLVSILILTIAACNQKVSYDAPGEELTEQVPVSFDATQGLEVLSETTTPNSIELTAQVSTSEADEKFLFNPDLCVDSFCVLETLQLFKRPIAHGLVNWIDRTYPFGSTGGGNYAIHHGVEFMNPAGTDVLAVGEGMVVVAGDDLEIKYADYKNFYGNLVIIQHFVEELSVPIFSLYGHLSDIFVEPGQEVSEGQVIGSVGATGSAIGSHLHFEFRLREPEYSHNVNPVLWLAPRMTEADGPLGTLAGVVTDRWGNPVTLKQITLEALQKNAQGRYLRYYIVTYADGIMTQNSPYLENFSLADLPTGEYRLSMVNGKLIERTITIYPGQTSFITIRTP